MTATFNAIQCNSATATRYANFVAALQFGCRPVLRIAERRGYPGLLRDVIPCRLPSGTTPHLRHLSTTRRGILVKAGTPIGLNIQAELAYQGVIEVSCQF